MVLPIADDNPVRRVPVITYLLIAINIAVFLGEPIAFGTTRTTTIERACTEQAYFLRWAAIPVEVVHNQAASLTVGPPLTAESCSVVKPSYTKSPILSVLTAMFVHGGWLHLLGNMLFLYVFGNNVEDRMGRLRFLLFYVAVGYLATYGFALGAPNSTAPLVGASGAIAGALGAYFVLFPRAPVTVVVPPLIFWPFRLPAWVVLGMWFVLQYFYASGSGLEGGSGVAYAAHVIGFAVGALYAWLHRRRFGLRPMGYTG